MFECGAIAFGILAIGHVPFFPNWIAGYEHRFARQALAEPAHESLFVLFQRAGLYVPALPTALMLAIAGGGYLWWSRKRDWTIALLIVYWATLALGPEASFDRILAATFPIFVVLARRPLAIAVVLVTLLIAGSRIGSADFASGAGPVAVLWLPVLLALGFLLMPPNRAVNRK